MDGRLVCPARGTEGGGWVWTSQAFPRVGQFCLLSTYIEDSFSCLYHPKCYRGKIVTMAGNIDIFWQCLTWMLIFINIFFILFFIVRLLSVLHGHSFFSSPPQRPMIFYPRFYPLHLFSYLNSWESECWWHWQNLFSMFSMFVDAEKA